MCWFQSFHVPIVEVFGEARAAMAEILAYLEKFRVGGEQAARSRVVTRLDCGIRGIRKRRGSWILS